MNRKISKSMGKFYGPPTVKPFSNFQDGKDSDQFRNHNATDVATGLEGVVDDFGKVSLNANGSGNSKLSMNVDQQQSEAGEEEASSLNKKQTPFHGYMYQLKLLMLFLMRAPNIGVSFFLGTEIEKAGKFDDIVFKYTKNGKQRYCLLQAKHKQDNNYKVTSDDLFTKEDGPFNLQKYFFSYRKIKHTPEFKDVEDFIIFTNASLAKGLQDSFEKSTDKDSIFDIVVKNSNKKSKYLKLKKGELLNELKRCASICASITDKEIEDFSEHLVFAVNQPNEIELGEDIKNELGEEFNLIDYNFIYSNFLEVILDWVKEKKRSFLSNEDGKELFEQIKQRVARLVAIGPTSLHRQELKELNVTFENEDVTIKELKDLLIDNNIKIVHLITEDTLLGAIKVDNVLNRISLYQEKEDSHIFVKLDTLLVIKERLMKAFKSEKNNLLVIQCNPTNKSIQELCSELSQILLDKSDKKVILITQEGNVLADQVRDKLCLGKGGGSGSDKYRKIEDKNNGFKDLNSESQENLKEKEVVFQGQAIKLGLLTTPEFLKQFICGKELVNLTEGKEIKVGGALPVSDHADIERTFGSKVVVQEGALESNSNDIFMISKAKPRYFEKHTNSNKVIRLNDNDPETHFKQVCEEKKEHNVHWLSRECVERKLVLVHKKSQGSLRELCENMNVKNDEKEDKFIQRKLAIITGESGIGKSFTMERLFRQIKKSDSSLWIVKINLAGCRSQLSKVNFDHNNFIDFLLTSAQLSTELEKALFKYNLLDQENKIALLFDGFDEIGSTYEKEILSLLKILKDLPSVNKLYISVRPYMKYQLEDSLGILSCELGLLELQDQKKFLQYLLKKEISESSNVDEKRISTFVDKLLESCSKIINGAFSLDNPLHLEILAKFFEEEFQEFCDNGNECNIELDNFNLLKLYEYYLACKICIHIDKISTLFNTEFAKLLNKDDLLHGKRREKEEALKHLSRYKKEFAAIFLEILFGGKEYSNQLKLGQKYKDDLYKIGTLHQCFYEYHVAEFFVDEYLEDPNNRDLRIFELLKKYYFHPDGKGMRHFFDLIVSRDYSLHVDVINENFNEVKKLIESKDEDERKKLLKVDGQGRSILHLIDDSTVKKFADSVSEEIKNSKRGSDNKVLFALIESKDKVFGYTPLEYALRSGNWRTANKLLELRGYFNSTCYTFSANKESISRDEKLLTTLDVLSTNSSTSSGSILCMAIKEGYFYLGLWMIGNLKDAELEKEDSDGRKPLYYIMYKNKVPHSPFHMLKLISNRVDLNKPDRFGQTAAHFSVLMMNKKKMGKAKKDEDVFLKDHSISFMSDVLDILKKRRINMNVCDASGNAPIHLVSDRLDVIKYLIEEGFDIDLNLPRKDGKTLVHLAAIRGDVQMIKYLAFEDASLNERDSDGNTPLHLAAIERKDCGQCVALEMVKFLVESYVDFNVENNYGETPLKVAACDVRKYLNDLPDYKEYLRDEALRITEELQELIICMDVELTKPLEELKNGKEKLLEAMSQQNSRLRVVKHGREIQDSYLQKEEQEFHKKAEEFLEQWKQYEQMLPDSAKVKKIEENQSLHTTILRAIMKKTEEDNSLHTTTLRTIIKKIQDMWVQFSEFKGAESLFQHSKRLLAKIRSAKLGVKEIIDRRKTYLKDLAGLQANNRKSCISLQKQEESISDCFDFQAQLLNKISALLSENFSEKMLKQKGEYLSKLKNLIETLSHKSSAFLPYKTHHCQHSNILKYPQLQQRIPSNSFKEDSFRQDLTLHHKINYRAYQQDAFSLQEKVSHDIFSFHTNPDQQRQHNSNCGQSESQFLKATDETNGESKPSSRNKLKRKRGNTQEECSTDTHSVKRTRKDSNNQVEGMANVKLSKTLNQQVSRKVVATESSKKPDTSLNETSAVKEISNVLELLN